MVLANLKHMRPAPRGEDYNKLSNHTTTLLLPLQDEAKGVGGANATYYLIFGDFPANTTVYTSYITCPHERPTT
jgi:hypothetical protein